MKKIIEFKNTNFAYNSQNKFEDFCMDIDATDIVSLIGPSGSGKTSILKMICHRLPNETVYYNGQKIGSYNINDIRRKIIVVFDEPFRKTTIEDELIQYLGVCDLTILESFARPHPKSAITFVSLRSFNSFAITSTGSSNHFDFEISLCL